MASFASQVKHELQGVTRMPTHCRRAQNAARRIYAAHPDGGAADMFEPKKDCCIRAYLRGAFRLRPYPTHRLYRSLDVQTPISCAHAF